MRLYRGSMDRIEVLACLYRGPDGRIQETEFPKTEPAPYAVAADLYCPSYSVRRGLLGPARLENLEVTIFNTRAYRPDPELEQVAKDRLLQTILAKEGPEIIETSGGEAAVRERITIDTWWRLPGE